MHFTLKNSDGSEWKKKKKIIIYILLKKLKGYAKMEVAVKRVSGQKKIGNRWILNPMTNRLFDLKFDGFWVLPSERFSIPKATYIRTAYALYKNTYTSVLIIILHS